MYKHGSECLSPAQFSASWTLQAVTGAQEAGNAYARSRPTVRAACSSVVILTTQLASDDIWTNCKLT